MENFLSGSVAELQQAKADIQRATKLNEELYESERLLTANNKDLDAQKKFISDKIQSSIKNRREELVKHHDEQINEVRKSIKEIEKDRKAAKTAAINSRINGETGSIAEENTKLQTQIKNILKQAGIPGFCNTRLYLALFSPRNLKDFLICAAAILVCIAAIPNIVCLLLDVKLIFKILIYIGIIIVFFAIYFLTYIMTRSKSDAAALERVRAIRKKIKVNKKQIKAMSADIRIDDDESSYGLEGFDRELHHANEVLIEKENAKRAALADFDAVTAAQIRSEIERENADAIAQLQSNGAALKADFQSKDAAAQEAIALVTNSYATYLGVKNTNADKIDEMIAVIEEGKAQTIMQALDIINGEIK